MRPRVGCGTRHQQLKNIIKLRSKSDLIKLFFGVSLNSNLKVSFLLFKQIRNALCKLQCDLFFGVFLENDIRLICTFLLAFFSCFSFLHFNFQGLCWKVYLGWAQTNLQFYLRYNNAWYWSASVWTVCDGLAMIQVKKQDKSFSLSLQLRFKANPLNKNCH
jgi:hypothetical protein